MGIWTRNNVSRFVADERGASAMELLVSLPLLVGMMLITANYGLLLNTREALDSATRDAARLLMRAPAGCVADATPGNGFNQRPEPYPFFVGQAQQLIADRMGVDLADVTLGTPGQPVQVFFVPGSEALAGQAYFAVVVQVTVEMDRFALLETFIGDTTLTAAETGRWFSDIAMCTEGCLVSDQQGGLCS
ncbi:MAG: TadE family protein [Pseudomonadota bacterium]